MLIKFTQEEHNRFQSILDEAEEAGRQANLNFNPVPMVVGTAKDIFSNEIDYSKETYFVADGVCGFAWISIGAANHRFAKWLVQTGKARKDFDKGGIRISITQYNQSMQRKEIHAEAMAKVIKNRVSGLKYCYANSMMD